ncbi:MAG: GNAT family N-acetyltransferase [Oscillospiraceae bacterium]|nr:GNAT family N-acetyltransferase [Oscillospiraceae bacterium]
MNDIAIRPARSEDVRPALALAIRVYMIYSAPLYAPEAVEYFPTKCRDEERILEFMEGKRLMFTAWDGERLVGMAAQRGASVSHLYVDPAYHRRGIATKLMDALIAAMGVPVVTLGSSPHAVPFYLRYGFVPTDEEQHKFGAIWQPMAYDVPVEIQK